MAKRSANGVRAHAVGQELAWVPELSRSTTVTIPGVSASTCTAHPTSQFQQYRWQAPAPAAQQDLCRLRLERLLRPCAKGLQPDPVGVEPIGHGLERRDLLGQRSRRRVDDRGEPIRFRREACTHRAVGLRVRRRNAREACARALEIAEQAQRMAIGEHVAEIDLRPHQLETMAL